MFVFTRGKKPTQWLIIFIRVNNSTKWVEIYVKSFLSSTGYNTQFGSRTIKSKFFEFQTPKTFFSSVLRAKCENENPFDY